MTTPNIDPPRPEKSPPQVELLAEMLKQIAQELEQTKEELAQVKETLKNQKRVEYQQTLPKTDLLSPNFWTRAPAVFGHWLVISILFTVAFSPLLFCVAIILEDIF